MNTCRTCRHWQTSRPDRNGEPRPVPMLRHRMAACAKGDSWRFFPRKYPACRLYQTISPAALQRRENTIADLQANSDHLKK